MDGLSNIEYDLQKFTPFYLFELFLINKCKNGIKTNWKRMLASLSECNEFQTGAVLFYIYIFYKKKRNVLNENNVLTLGLH